MGNSQEILYMTSKGHMVYDNKYKVYYELRDDMKINQEQEKAA